MRLLPLATLLLLGLLPSASHAQVASIGVPENSKFVVHVNMDAVRKSALGNKLLLMATGEAAKAVVDETGNEAGLEMINEALGFDPLKEIRSLTIVGDDFENPRPQLVLSLGKTTGNLEGMALGLPEYESSEHGKYTIHTAASGDERAFAAIHTDKAGRKKIVGATTHDEVTAMLDQLDVATAGQNQRAVEVGDKALVHIRLLELPTEEFGEGPQQNIIKLLKDFVVTIDDADGNFELNVQLTTENKKQAEQIQQMAQGLIAMASFIQSDQHDEELQQLQQVLQGLRIKRDNKSVHLTVQVPTDEVIDFLREEADLPF